MSAIKEVPIGIEGYDVDVDGSRAKDDTEVFGRGCSREHPGTVIRWLDGTVGGRYRARGHSRRVSPRLTVG